MKKIYLRTIPFIFFLLIVACWVTQPRKSKPAETPPPIRVTASAGEKPDGGVTVSVPDETGERPEIGSETEEQRKANEEANRYVLPVTAYKGQPDVGDSTPHESDARKLPPEVQAELDREALAVTGVRLNKIGLARLNKRRKAQGLPPLVAGVDVQIAPIGQDLVVEPAAISEGPKSGGGAGEDTESPGTTDQSGFDGEVFKAGGAGGFVDNSTLQYFPPIRDQGSVDSCVGWSEIYYATTHAVAMAYGWDAKNGGDDFRFAPLFTYNFLNEGRSKYTYFTTHFDIARHHGAVRWSEMSSASDFRAWVTDEDAYLRALTTKTNGYSTIFNMSTSGIDTLKASLDNGHVAAFATFFRGWVFDTIDNDPNTTEDDAYAGLQIAHNLNNTSGGHAMVIVGYNDHIWLDLNNDGVVDANEKGGFKVANSDGTGWKNGGYAYITYDVVRKWSTITGHDGDGLIWQNRVRIASVKTLQHEPTLVARVTINHTKRNQVKVQLGISATSSTTPTSLQTTKIITDTPYTSVYQGGAYAFSGAAAASEDFTYYLDFSDVTLSPGNTGRFHVSGTDSGATDGDLTIKNFELYYLHEGDYHLVGTAGNTPAVASGSTANVWIDWIMGEVKPNISLTATDAEAAEEGQDPGVWTITREGDLTDPLTVYFTLDGTATAGTDYTVDLSSPVTFSSGQASVSVTLTPIDDSVFAEFESAEMTLTADAAYVISTPNPAGIVITDNDNHPPVVDAGPDQSATLVTGSGGGAPVAGAYWEWDASADTPGDTVWESEVGTTYNWTFDDGAQSPSAVVDARFDRLSFAYDFPEAKDASNTAFRNNGHNEPAVFEFVIDVDGADGSIFESGGSGDGIQFDVVDGVLRGTVQESPPARVEYTLTPEDLGRFIHVVFLADSVNDVVQLYVDNELKGSVAWTESAWSGQDNASLGHVSGTTPTGGSTEQFDGKMALFRYYRNTVFDSADVTTNFNALSNGTAATLNLEGTVSDADGSTPATNWSKVSGPGDVSFADSSAVNTTATINQAGTYVLLLTANDGFGEVSDPITITVIEDSDGDGLDDAWEQEFLGNLDAGPEDDTDGDGLSNAKEWIAGTHPDQTDSVFEVSLNQTAGENRLQALRIAGRYYRVSWRASLTGGDWTSVAGHDGTQPSDGSSLDLPLTESGFYRLEVSGSPFNP